MGGLDMNTKKIKNKDFLKWTKAETCFRKDNIVSTDWHERLERVPMFVPTYAKCRPEMMYIMSMEYSRIWQKEKDEWFAQIFKAQPKEQDIKNRKRKLRKEFLEAKRQAEIKIKERKERLAKEAEAKAKAEAEAQEKAKRIKAKLEKCTVKKKDAHKKKNKAEETEMQQQTEAESDKKGDCPKGWTQVELTLQCECAAKNKDGQIDGKKDEIEQIKENVPEEVKRQPEMCSPMCMNEQIAQAVEREKQKEESFECKGHECLNE